MPAYGVVAEFNPFHSGHQYLVNRLKSDGVSTVTAVLSESFVQRGDCALLPPPDRVRAALCSGIDLVLSLPVPYALASAGNFARGGVRTLFASGVANTLAFGSECANEALLLGCAKALSDEKTEKAIGEELQKGTSYPSSRERAVRALYGKETAAVLRNPNDTLGIEYLRALLSEFPETPFCAVGRKGAPHDSVKPCEEGEGVFCSASLLRDKCRLGEDISALLPACSAAVLEEAIREKNAPADFGRLENAILACLRKMNETDFSRVPDVSEGLENKIVRAVRSSRSLEETVDKIKSKRYTHSRIRRILLCAFLGIEKPTPMLYPPYVRVLGFRKGSGEALLRRMKETSSLPVITKPSQVRFLGNEGKALFALECRARDLYSLALPQNDLCGREMTDGVIVTE